MRIRMKDGIRISHFKIFFGSKFNALTTRGWSCLLYQKEGLKEWAFGWEVDFKLVLADPAGSGVCA